LTFFLAGFFFAGFLLGLGLGLAFGFFLRPKDSSDSEGSEPNESSSEYFVDFFLLFLAFSSLSEPEPSVTKSSYKTFRRRCGRRGL